MYSDTATTTRALAPARYSLTAVLRRGERLDERDLAVRRVVLHDRIDGPFRLRLTVVTDALAFEIDDLAHARVELEIARDDACRRVVGVVLGAEILGIWGGQLHLRLDVGPAIGLLAHSRRSRVFEGCTVPEIVAAVVGPTFARVGAVLDVSRLSQTYRPRDYCVQLGETDLGFVRRILAEEGIATIFEGEGSRDAMVLVDAVSAFLPVGAFDPDRSEGGSPTILPLLTGRGPVALEGITQFTHARTTGPATWSVDAWDDESAPSCVLSDRVDDGTRGGDPWQLGEVAVHAPRRPADPERGDPTPQWVRAQAERDRSDTHRCVGRANAVALRAGATFELDGHPHPDLDGQYLLTEVVHRGDCPDVELGAGADAAEPEHTVEITAVPLRLPYRPAPRPKPRALGPCTAIVVGDEHNPDEEIHTDALGRVRVRFPWSDVESDAARSCWLRVVQAWAGAGFGTYFVPRVGMEVVVAFLDGDPDRPIVSGCVYDGSNPFPQTLPDERTKSGIKTRSTPGGDGHNELRFEDATGREEIFVHAQRNLREVVRANRSARIGGSSTTTIGGAREDEIAKDETLRVHGIRRVYVDKHCDEIVEGSYTLQAVGSDEKAPNGIFITTGRNMLVEAAHSIVFKCGESTIAMTPAGIELSAVGIDISSTAATMPSCVHVGEGGPELEGARVVAKSVDAELNLTDKVELSGCRSAAGGTLTLHQDAVLTASSGAASVGGINATVEGTKTTTIEGGQCCAIKSAVTAIEGEGSLSLATKGVATIDGKASVVVCGGTIHLN